MRSFVWHDLVCDVFFNARTYYFITILQNKHCICFLGFIFLLRCFHFWCILRLAYYLNNYLQYPILTIPVCYVLNVCLWLLFSFIVSFIN